MKSILTFQTSLCHELSPKVELPPNISPPASPMVHHHKNNNKYGNGDDLIIPYNNDTSSLSSSPDKNIHHTTSTPEATTTHRRVSIKGVVSEKTKRLRRKSVANTNMERRNQWLNQLMNHKFSNAQNFLKLKSNRLRQQLSSSTTNDNHTLSNDDPYLAPIH